MINEASEFATLMTLDAVDDPRLAANAEISKIGNLPTCLER
jgi:hypothetical protein